MCCKLPLVRTNLVHCYEGNSPCGLMAAEYLVYKVSLDTLYTPYIFTSVDRIREIARKLKGLVAQLTAMSLSFPFKSTCIVVKSYYPCIQWIICFIKVDLVLTSQFQIYNFAFWEWKGMKQLWGHLQTL